MTYIIKNKKIKNLTKSNNKNKSNKIRKNHRKTKIHQKTKNHRRKGGDHKQFSNVLNKDYQHFSSILNVGDIIYKQKFEKQFTIRNNFEWFSQVYNYGSVSSYGSFLDTYKVQKQMVFFDLGKIGARNFLLQNFFYGVGGDQQDICDLQYNGGKDNLKFHRNIESFLNDNGFLGTIVNNDNDLFQCGVDEIVFSPQTSSNHRDYILKTKEEVLDTDNL